MVSHHYNLRRRRKHTASAFTLIEAMFAVAIVGFSIAGLMLVMGSGTRVNMFGQQVSTASFLAEELHSIVDNTPFDQLVDLDNQTFNAVDSLGNPIEGLENYSQHLSVTYINPATLQVATLGDPQVAVRITAVVFCDDQQVTSYTWLRIQ
ncbi:MAG: type II secretion system protein [Sedimentisphaerales bacterium]|nr:type II secretion system protein [Sedimentisphaerales bacterium]